MDRSPALSPASLSALERRLLDEFQRGFPLTARPYAEIAGRLGVGENEIIDALRTLGERGAVSRIGAVLAPRQAGASTLAALAVPEDRLDEVAAMVTSYGEVNHNYEREHAYNLWFVVTAPDQERVHAVLDEIETRTGLSVLDLPLVEAYRLDLGFPLQWT